MTKSTFDEHKTTKNYETELLDKMESKESPVLKSGEQTLLQTNQINKKRGKKYEAISTTFSMIVLFVSVIYITDEYYQRFISYWAMFAVIMAMSAIAVITGIISRRLSKKDEPK